MSMESLSKVTSGAIFVLCFCLTVVSSPDTWLIISTVDVDKLLGWIASPQGIVLVSLNFVLLVFLISLIATLSFLIDEIWDFIFYVRGGYNRKEYMPIRKKLLDLLPDEYEFKSEIENMPVQSIYGQFLHSFAKQTFVKWLSRRWNAYHSAYTYSIAIFLSISLGTIVLRSYGREFSEWTGVIGLIAVLVICIQLYVGHKRKKELLMSERLFCLSVMDDDVAKAFDEISDIIIRRDRHSNEDMDPDLGSRL